ncbi:MAG: hypothetical protein EA370_07575 [Wenzhouxiangella sp.]|nr:MAG: hypothetical protein EA370_07575 [Wenzhouxiangella sp.]
MADKKLNSKSMVTTVGALAALSFSAASFAAEPNLDNLFEARDLDRGFMVASAGFGEGACGEGKCGEGKCGEGSCGEEESEEEKSEEEKGEEGACGEGACGEGKCGEGTCGA